MRRLLLAVVPLLATAAVAASAPVEPQPLPLDQQLQQARSEAASAEAEQHRLDSAAAQARSDAERLQLQENAAAQAIDAAEAWIAATDAAAQLLASRLAEQRQRLAEEQAPASSLLGALALMSRRPAILLLADSRSPEEMVKLRLLADAVLPAVRAKTAALSTELREAERLRQAALAARTDAVANRADLVRREREFAELEARANELAQSRGGQALAAGDVAIATEEQSSVLQGEVQSGRSAAAIALQLEAIGPAPERPVAPDGPPQPPPFAYHLPATAPVTEGLGEVSDSGIRSHGITLATARGSAIAAPAAGTILFSGPFRDFNGVVIIDHGGGWKSVLINVASTLPNGSRLSQGERLGTALGPIEVQLLSGGTPVSAALIAGSSAVLSNREKQG
jgi:septal ring factor EnvC (AmiA/AmiB activator)